MNCQKLQEQFDDRLDGRLDAALLKEFEAHLAGCAACRREWQAYEAVWAVVGRHETIAPSVGFTARTLRRLHESAAPERVRIWQLPVFRWATLGNSVKLPEEPWVTGVP